MSKPVNGATKESKRMGRNIYSKMAALVLAAGMLGGCVTTEQVKQMEADLARAQETADAALAAAEVADRKASAAMDAANAAQDSANECSERCDRMMKKVMAK